MVSVQSPIRHKTYTPPRMVTTIREVVIGIVLMSTSVWMDVCLSVEWSVDGYDIALAHLTNIRVGNVYTEANN